MPLDTKVWDGMVFEGFEPSLGQGHGHLVRSFHHSHVVNITSEVPEDDIVRVSTCWYKKKTGLGKIDQETSRFLEFNVFR